ncbi:hypothetical protein F5148DRAFT_240615 [Russula earlei]|uniref:Uncharacterized protein n=1 Tax=Russula earlei TaxID=71964 RepID=A0ACC0U3Q7_9AGAM|nr:hypothetical protein F5148DRAFT_240615 [Russula earlei]
MSSAPYQPLPRDDYDDEASPTPHRYNLEHFQLSQDPRFNPPTPPWWKRALLLLFIVFLFWLSFTIRVSLKKEADSQIVHAHRYSKEHKYRPAASPIIYEKLKDGRTRVRGAAPSLRSL